MLRQSGVIGQHDCAVTTHANYEVRNLTLTSAGGESEIYSGEVWYTGVTPNELVDSYANAVYEHNLGRIGGPVTRNLALKPILTDEPTTEGTDIADIDVYIGGQAIDVPDDIHIEAWLQILTGGEKQYVEAAADAAGSALAIYAIGLGGTMAGGSPYPSARVAGTNPVAWVGTPDPPT